MRKTYLMFLMLMLCVMLGVPLAHANPSGWNPSDIRSMYKLAKDGSSATTIVLVSAFAQPNLEANLGTYRSMFGLPSCTVANGCLKIVGPDGTGNTVPVTQDAAWTINADTQVQMASIGCKLCKLTVVLATDGTVAKLADAAVEAPNLGTFVHAGFGFAESNTTQRNAIESAFSAGVNALIAPSGDGNAAIQYPASSPGAIGVSRTSVATALNSRGYTETLAGGRSGFSAVFSRQTAWEPNLGSSAHNVVTAAMIGTSVAVYTGGAWTQQTGTLIASAIFVGAIAGLEGTILLPGDLAGVSLFDTTSGTDDTSHTAASGFDEASGFGAVDFTSL